MNKKNILKTIVKKCRKYNFSINTIIIIAGSVLLLLYGVEKVNNFFSSLLNKFMGPFYYAWKRINDFSRAHKNSIIKIESILAIVLFIVYLGGNGKINFFINEQMGVYAKEADDTFYLENSETTKIINDIYADVKETETKQSEDIEDSVETVPVLEKDMLPYYITVNLYYNTVTVYTYDSEGNYNVPVKAMTCAAGGESTPEGIFSLSDKFRFAQLLYQSYGQYCTRVNGSILFHSSTYTSLKKDSLSGADYNLLGESVSHGCIRLTTADAKWIYDNCDEGTITVIYDDESSPGPLGKPETIKVPEDTLWDPTDPDPENPWNKMAPHITGTSDKVYYEYDIVDLMSGVRATDTCGNDITDMVKIEGDVNVDIPGYYNIKYTVTDLLGRTAECEVVITIK